MSLGRAEDASFVAGVVVCCRCHWESRPQEGGGIAQAWATWPEGASAPNGTMMCRGHGVPEMVTPAMRTTTVLLGFLNSGLGHVARRCFGTKWYDEGASAPNGTMMCQGHGVPEMVTPAMRTTAVLLGFLNSGLGHVARRCFGTKWYDDVPGARSTRDGDTGNEDNSSHRQ